MNNKFKFCIAAALSSVLVASSVVCSANSIGTMRVDPDKEILSVEGFLDKKTAGALIDLWVTTEDGNPVIVRQSKSDSDGKYSFDVDLSASIARGGVFKLSVASQTENLAKYVTDDGSETFSVYLTAEIASALKTLVDNRDDVTKNETALKDEYTRNIIAYRVPAIKPFMTDDMAKEIADFISQSNIDENNVVDALKLIAEVKTVQCGTDAQILELLNNENALKALKNNETFKKLESKLFPDYAKQLSKSAAVYNSENDLVKDAEEKVVVTEVCFARGTEATAKVLDKYSDKFDFTVYNKSGNDTDAVLKSIQKLVENGSLQTAAQVQQKLDTYIEKDSGSGSGGGSGSGSGKKTGGSSSISAGTGSIAITPIDGENVTPDIKNFKDLQGFDWAKDSIEKLCSAGIINGISDDEFAPAQNVTRAQFCKMAAKVFGLKIQDTADTFADVTKDDWFSPYVKALYDAGAVTGIDATHFNPDGEVTRQDVCAIIYRMLKSERDDLTAGELQFADAETVADYAREAVAALANAGLIKGDNSNCLPTVAMTRAETAVLISRINDYRNGVKR